MTSVTPSPQEFRPIPKLTRDFVTFSRHAVSRALDMGVDSLEISSALFSPDGVFWSAKHESWTFVSGRVACGVFIEGDGLATVLTVLWRSREDWKKDLDRGVYGGRAVR